MDIKIAALETQKFIDQNTSKSKWPPEGPLSLPHIQNLLFLVADGSVTGEKAHRWLGWSQCAVVAAGCGTLEDMKQINVLA